MRMDREPLVDVPDRIQLPGGAGGQTWEFVERVQRILDTRACLKNIGISSF